MISTKQKLLEAAALRGACNDSSCLELKICPQFTLGDSIFCAFCGHEPFKHELKKSSEEVKHSSASTSCVDLTSENTSTVPTDFREVVHVTHPSTSQNASQELAKRKWASFMKQTPKTREVRLNRTFQVNCDQCKELPAHQTCKDHVKFRYPRYFDKTRLAFAELSRWNLRGTTNIE
jgi:hypothetical protein